MKTEKELNAIKEVYDNLNDTLNGLTMEELDWVTGGLESLPPINPNERYVMLVRPTPVPFQPIVSKKCLHKPCAYSSKELCPYYSDDIGDCNY